MGSPSSFFRRKFVGTRFPLARSEACVPRRLCISLRVLSGFGEFLVPACVLLQNLFGAFVLFCDYTAHFLVDNLSTVVWSTAL